MFASELTKKEMVPQRRQQRSHLPHLLPAECPMREYFQGTSHDGKGGDDLADRNNV